MTRTTQRQEKFTIEAVREPEPGHRLARFFDEYWPAYAKWMRRAEPMPTAQCLGALRKHMPEIVPIFEQIHERVGGGDRESRFLSLYCPPRLVRACSQAVLDSPEPTLIRTYDFSPQLFDGILLHAEWGGVNTIAMTDCLWGALDGINEHGLAVALAFGGRNAVGPGFAAPLITRYLLQTCSTADQAARALERIPVFMPYTFVVVDREGARVTAMLGPDRTPVIDERGASTNHHTENDWPEYQRQTRSVERLIEIERSLEQADSVDDLLPTFLQPPVWQADHSGGSGTLYAGVYRPRDRSVALHWPDRTAAFSLEDFTETTLEITLPTPAHPHVQFPDHGFPSAPRSGGRSNWVP